MAKCRSLLQENQDLGKQISQGRVAQLEAEIALQKKYNQEIKETQEGKCQQGLKDSLPKPVLQWNECVLNKHWHVVRDTSPTC